MDIRALLMMVGKGHMAYLVFTARSKKIPIISTSYENTPDALRCLHFGGY